MDDSEDSNCDAIHEDGLEGTIVKMPANCGPGKYVIARSMTRSKDQLLPRHLEAGAPHNATVMDLKFDYNFGLTKRATSDIFLRVDYSNQLGYWDHIVAAESKKRKRGERLDPRFFSSDSATWAQHFKDLENLEGNGYRTEFSKKFDQALYASKDESCNGDASYIDIDASGTATANSKWGFTFVVCCFDFHHICLLLTK